MHRRSLLPPIPEFETAATLLSEAADALIAGDLVTCAARIAQSDLRPLRDFHQKVAGKIDPEVHRQTGMPKFERVPKEQMPRMPSEARQLEIMARDGYRCRFCGARVFVKAAFHAFVRACPNEARHGGTNETDHYALRTLSASIDHIVPYARGGTNDPTNLLTACGPCQFGRNQWTLDEVEVEDPFQYPPVIDAWDGLARLIPYARAR